MTSNWANLKRKIVEDESKCTKGLKNKRTDLQDSLLGVVPAEKKIVDSQSVLRMTQAMKDKYVGLDCEMVGIGVGGKQSALARCCVVNFDGIVLYDHFVRPPQFVTDFRTKWSGVRKQDLRAMQACQESVAKLLWGKILVGHALKNDLTALLLSHNKNMIRDTATFRPYMRSHGKQGGKYRPRSLKDLTKEFLNTDIQTGEHDPGEDARSAVMLYRHKMQEWEKDLKDRKHMKKASKAGDSSAIAMTTAATATGTGDDNDDNDCEDKEPTGLDRDSDHLHELKPSSYGNTLSGSGSVRVRTHGRQQHQQSTATTSIYGVVDSKLFKRSSSISTVDLAMAARNKQAGFASSGSSGSSNKSGSHKSKKHGL